MKKKIFLLIGIFTVQLIGASDSKESREQEKKLRCRYLESILAGGKKPLSDLEIEKNSITTLTTELKLYDLTSAVSWQQKPLPLKNLCIQFCSNNHNNAYLNARKHLLPDDVQQDLACHNTAQTLLNKVLNIFSTVTTDTNITWRPVYSRFRHVYYTALIQALLAGARPRKMVVLKYTLQELHAIYPWESDAKNKYYETHRRMLDPTVEQPRYIEPDNPNALYPYRVQNGRLITSMQP